MTSDVIGKKGDLEILNFIDFKFFNLTENVSFSSPIGNGDLGDLKI